MRGNAKNGLFFDPPYFARGGAISETKQPWHEYRPPLTPNTTNNSPDASNRWPSPSGRWRWRDRGVGGSLGDVIPPTTPRIVSIHDDVGIVVARRASYGADLAAATPRSAAYDARLADVCWWLRLIVVFDDVLTDPAKRPIWYILQIGSSTMLFVPIKLIVVG